MESCFLSSRAGGEGSLFIVMLKSTVEISEVDELLIDMDLRCLDDRLVKSLS